MPDNRDAVERANEAQSILQSQVWKDAWEAIDGSLVEKWRNTRDAVEREELWRYCKITAKLKQYFEDAVRDGNFSRQKLDEAVKREDFMQQLKRRLRLPG